MKRIIIICAVGGLFVMSGCVKDWTCQCTDQSGDVTSHLINNQTLLNARDKCKAMDYNNTVLGISETCSIQ